MKTLIDKETKTHLQHYEDDHEIDFNFWKIRGFGIKGFEVKTMKKPLIRITARHPKTLKVLDLYFYSIAQAKKHNPHLIEFEEKEYIKR